MKTSDSRRSVRLADQIRRELAMLLIEEVQDPRLELVSISGVRLNRDMKIAEVAFTLDADPERIKDAGEALDSATGFLRSQLGRRLRMKFIPELRFVHDDFLEDMVYGRPGSPEDRG